MVFIKICGVGYAFAVGGHVVDLSGDCSGDVDGKSWQVCTPYSGDLKREAAEVAHGTS